MDHRQVGRFWNSNAEAWTRLSRAGYDVYRDCLNTPAFFEMLPDIAGLSGLGDLVLTRSRNHALGVALGQGASLAEALSGGRSVLEGVASAAAISALAARRGVDMPVVAAVDAVLHRGMAIDRMIEGLLARPRRAE